MAKHRCLDCGGHSTATEDGSCQYCGGPLDSRTMAQYGEPSHQNTRRCLECGIKILQGAIALSTHLSTSPKCADAWRQRQGVTQIPSIRKIHAESKPPYRHVMDRLDIVIPIIVGTLHVARVRSDGDRWAVSGVRPDGVRRDVRAFRHKSLACLVLQEYRNVQCVVGVG